MATARMEALRNMLQADPANGFARYGLAMEFVNAGDLEGGIAEFRALLERDPNYVAAYFHGGQALEKLGRAAEARAVYERGLVACSHIGDAHTRSEIQAALDLL